MRGWLRVYVMGGRFAVSAVVTDVGSEQQAAEGCRRAEIVARAFERELEATNLAVYRAYADGGFEEQLDIVEAARILDRAGVRP